MALKLMFITNQEKIARLAENSGVDWIFIDLEINGKDARQGHLDTVISRHSIHDVKKIKQVLTNSELLVRVNPIYQGSKNEIDRVIKDGADIVMLPFFKTKEEVELFVNYVNGRAKVCLLCETSEAVENIDSILTIKGIDYIHIGLNDLHLSYNMKFMFELLANGTVEMLCKKIAGKGIQFGFGGIAQLGQGALPAEKIIAEHYRLGSNMVILSRSFCNTNKSNDLNQIKEFFKLGLNEIREYENSLLNKEKCFFERNIEVVKEKVMEIVYTITK
ncbi:aldolase/citrate lyase family protein [Gracilibacillus sp. YIM 98692]|uniref:aldolase/citrate lyase family protein n=1 Tax=Gracilibacillus sp. YIM 98692 TaxID=2663532 RepID=UPI0013D0033F|nr:aldolase/citrate lyase family protein [Gracilibacillus sp. YIM 98692]